MDEKWSHHHHYQWHHYLVHYCVLLLLLCTVSSLAISNDNNSHNKFGESDAIDTELKQYVDSVLSQDEFALVPGIGVERSKDPLSQNNATEAQSESIQDYVHRKLDEYTATHVLSVNVSRSARFFSGAETGKSSFLTGFGMGFLAFGLKKLLLPVIIGAQLVKSVLIAMFLPSILGSVGKLLGKGLSSFSGISGASAGLNNHNNNNQQIDDFEFKDTNPYNAEDGAAAAVQDEFNLNVITTTASSLTPADSRFGVGNQRVSYIASQNDNYYMRKPSKKTDYKVFHKIPSSSLLLTSYDPFYSPLLSRLDAVFQQLGLGNDKSSETEKCRERLVCMMYANPAKYAPYSNLVSAQLSRELNELRKPASDNPDILRFFRYMKAAKDGQDGEECLAHKGCSSLTSNQPSPAILTTFNEINKLVQARKLN